MGIGKGRACTAFLGLLAAALVSIFHHFRVPAFANPPDVSVRLGSPGWGQDLRQNLAQHGYSHVQQLVTREEVLSLRAIVEDFCWGEERRALPLAWGGYSVPAFLELDAFAGARWLLRDERVHELLNATFGGRVYRFAGHNDAACNFVGVWHKDVLRGPFRKYQVHDLWGEDNEGETHEIYKLMFYLQDHDQDGAALKVIPGSHILRDISLERGQTVLQPRMGDAVIFDQRISHSGNTLYNPLGEGRMFMQLGFGRANVFTDEFEQGTTARQHGYQDKMLKSAQKRGSLAAVLADAKFFVMGGIMTCLPPLLLNALADINAEKYPTLARLILGTSAKQETAKAQ